jgi:hypothetical protein
MPSYTGQNMKSPLKSWIRALEIDRTNRAGSPSYAPVVIEELADNFGASCTQQSRRELLPAFRDHPGDAQRLGGTLR